MSRKHQILNALTMRSLAGVQVKELAAIFVKSCSRDIRRLVFTGVPHFFAALIGIQGLGLARRVLLARMLTLSELGQMAYVMQIADFVAMFADIGICSAVLKYAAEPVDENRKREIYTTGLFWAAALSSLVALFYLMVAIIFPMHELLAVRMYILITVPYVVMTAIVKTPMVFMQAMKEIRKAARLTVLTRILGLVINVTATWLYGLTGFFITVVLAPMANLFILMMATRSAIKWERFSMNGIRKLLSLGLISLLANITGVAKTLTAIIILRYVTHSDDQVGYFAIALIIYSGISMMPSALMQVAFPYLSALMTNCDVLFKKSHELARKQGAIMAFVFCIWLLSGHFIVTCVFGDRFDESFLPSVILLAGLVIFAVSAPASQLLLILGKVNINLYIGLVNLGTNIALCFVLIPLYGKVGAATSISVAQLVASVLSISASEKLRTDELKKRAY